MQSPAASFTPIPKHKLEEENNVEIDGVAKCKFYYYENNQQCPIVTL